MSLVVCSNQPQDAESSRNRNSISKPWAFKNTLTSTYTIPENAQVALTSCKVNIPERVVVGGNGNKFYHYLGNTPTEYDNQQQSTSWPVQVRLTEDDTDRETYEDLSPQDFASRLQSRIRATTYHPNFKGKALVTMEKESSTNKFLGYKITYDQNNSGDNASNIPTDNFKQWFGDYVGYDDNGSGNWTYTSGTQVFQRTNTSGTELGDGAVAAGINIQYPLSMNSGEFVVNVSDTAANANSSGVEWHVGLSRWINTAQEGSGRYAPDYDATQFYTQTELDCDQDIYADFAVARNTNGELVVYEHVVGDDGIYGKREVKYWLNSNSSFTGSGRASADGLKGKPITRVKFEVEGEVVKLEAYDGVAYRLITKYAAAVNDESYFKPANQCCWCLHPVLAIGRKDGAETSTLQIREYQGMDITGYDPTKKNGGGWYENNKIIGREMDSSSLDRRTIAAVGSSPKYVQTESNGSGGVDYPPVLILGESDVYTPSYGANSQNLLGYTKSVVDTATTNVGSLYEFVSTVIPSLAPQYSMFVRLNNLGQDVTNGLVGNKSKIIAHLTSFEQATGRLTHEPSTLTYLDLNNSMPLHISEFDISFCYVNEQFAEILTGQSIVTLHFRKKGEM